MSRKIKLVPEMIPRTSFFRNLRSMLNQTEWDVVRRECYRKAGHVCEICGGRGNRWPVECHEVWDYNVKDRVQKLVRLIALCPACHEVIHIGLAGVRGREKQAIKHLMKVNRLSELDALAVVAQAWQLWERRSGMNWTLNVDTVMEGQRHD